MSFRHTFPLIGLLLAVPLLTGPLQAQEVDPPFGDPEFISPDARLEMVFNEGLALTESPAEGPDGMIYFSDITFTTSAGADGIEAGHIWRYDPDTGETTIYRSPSGMSNGLKFDAQDRLIAAEGADQGGRRVTRTDMETGKAYIIAHEYEGRPFNAPNDVAIDEQGRVYFSDPKYIGNESVEQPVMAVYRIDTDGSIHRIITDAGKPNGVVVSPDQKTLYVVSNDNGSIDLGKITLDIPVHKGRMALLAYDLHEDGSATFRSVLVDYLPEGWAGRPGRRRRRQPVRVRARRDPAGHRHPRAGRYGKGLHPHRRAAHQRGLRTGREQQDPVHHRGYWPLPDPRDEGRLPPAAGVNARPTLP